MNIVLLVWDACRADAVGNYAPNLQHIADNNIEFTNAFAPSTWSLPSHASMLSGEYPHSHGLTTGKDRIDSIPMLESAGDNGYTRYAVTRNGFVTYNQGYDDFFDDIRYTLHRRIPDGIDIQEVINSLESTSDKGSFRKGLSVLGAALRHENQPSSIQNFGYFLHHYLLNKFSSVADNIPHEWFDTSGLYRYSPWWNTENIQQIVDSEGQNGDPFFLFSNYMDTHYPYYPTADHQEALSDENISYQEAKQINEKYGRPIEFISLDESDNIDEDSVKVLRNLYMGAVRGADKHLGLVIDALEDAGLREETLIVITSDHGERLGEVDQFGDRRFGDICSVSDESLRVPLVVANPLLNSKKNKRSGVNSKSWTLV